MTDFEIFLAGDAIITLPWSQVKEPAFLNLVEKMRGADVTIINLETVIHSFKGYAQAESGGAWTTSPPIIARQLAWAGVDMVSHANNHAFDYGSEGVLETLEHIKKAGIVLSGSGCDLQNARAPQYFESSGRKIAHISMAATFVPYGKASKSRPDMRGRPGVNPLAVTAKPVVSITPAIAASMGRIAGLFGKDTSKYERSSFEKSGIRFEIGQGFKLKTGRRITVKDREENLAAISRGANHADITVVSIHAHDQSPWLRRFAKEAIGAGADIIFVHGVHEVRGVEIVDNCPVFYGLGDFVFQLKQIERQPSEAYENLGLDDSAKPEDIAAASAAWAQSAKKKSFEGCAAKLCFSGKKLVEIQLLPLDLHFGANRKDNGRPALAGPELGKNIIQEIAKNSKSFGTSVLYKQDQNIGCILLDGKITDG